MRKLIFVFSVFAVAGIGYVLAQTAPSLTQGEVPTILQWQSFFSSKVDVTNGTLNSPTINTPTLNSPSIPSPLTVVAPALTANDSTAVTAAWVNSQPSNLAVANIYDYGTPSTTCVGTQSSADSTALAAALATHNTVYIPRINPSSGAASNCVLGNINLTGSEQLLKSDYATVTPLTGSNYVFKVAGFKNGMQGFYINDNGGVTAQTTLSATAASSATTVTIGSVIGPAVQIGQRYSIHLDTGSWATGYVTNVSGSVVTLSEALPSQASSGATFWSTFGAIYVTNATWSDVSNITFNNAWGGILMDDPTVGLSASVNKGIFQNFEFTADRMFAVWKGRNVHDNLIHGVEGWGGYASVNNYTGNGSTTTFALSERVNLTRELTVTVNGVTLTNGTDYTVASNGLSVTFTSPPAVSAPIVLNLWAYGHDGYGEDGRIGVEGGNDVSGLLMLDYQRCGNLVGAQLYKIHDSTFDTCGEDALLINGASQTGMLSNVFAGWGVNNSLHVTGNAAGTKVSGVRLNPVPSATSRTGTAGTDVLIDAGSALAGTLNSQQDGSYRWYAGSLAGCISSTGQFQILGKTATTCTFDNQFSLLGTTGTFRMSNLGTTIGFSYGGFNYVTADSNNAQLVLQANGTNGVVQNQASSTVKATIGSTDELTVTSANTSVANPLLANSGASVTGGLSADSMIGPLQFQGAGGVSATPSAPGIASPTGINTGSVYQLGAGGFFTGSYVLGTASNANNLVSIDLNNTVPSSTFVQPTAITAYQQVWYGEQGAERSGFGLFGRCDLMPTAFNSLTAASCKHEFDIQNWSGILPNSGTSFLANGTLPTATATTNGTAVASTVTQSTNQASPNGVTLFFSSTGSIPLWSLVSAASPIQLTTANPAVNTVTASTTTSISNAKVLHFGTTSLTGVSQGMLAVGSGISGLVTVTAVSINGSDNTVTLNQSVTVGSSVAITFIGSTVSFTTSPASAGVLQGMGAVWNVGFPGGVWQVPTASGYAPGSSSAVLSLPAYETTGTPGIYQPLQPGRTVSFSPILWGTYVSSIASSSINLSIPVQASGVANGASISFQSGNVLCSASWGSNILTGEVITAAGGEIPFNTHDLLLHSGQTGQGCSSDPMVLDQAATGLGVTNGEVITATPAQNSAYPTQTGPTKSNMGLIGNTVDCFGSAGCNIGYTLGTTQPWETGLYFSPAQVYGMGIVVDAGSSDPSATNNPNQGVTGPRVSAILRNMGDAADKTNLVLQTMGSQVASNPVLRVMTSAGNPNETTNTGEVFRINQDGSPVTAGTTSGYFNTQQVILTATSGTWTVPFNVNRVRVLMCGAGGGGGSVGGGAAATATGGTSGVWLSAYYSVTPGGSVSYAVGQAGTGGASGGTNNGNPGGNTTFGTVTANGGLGGIASNSGNAAAPTTTSVNGLIPIANPNNSILLDNWFVMNAVAGSSGSGSNGGKSIWGTAGTGGTNAAGNNAGASQFCSGGGGAGASSAVSFAGGNGANGLIVVLY